ncbi:uncharacterized protein [Leptinotarsa decemlineata]|uniref:uncharacterized protein n=1 Tax=Leptinotarsa decemlineata TaxID=7539 RepID=UPI003D30BF2C
MMRAAGGCNTHPESIQVGQIFRLMSLYSLIKPPRESNVSGGEMMKSLLHIGDLKEKQQKFIFYIEIEETISEIEEDFSGCEHHKEELSREALRAYLISRLNICCAKEHNERALEGALENKNFKKYNFL